MNQTHPLSSYPFNQPCNCHGTDARNAPHGGGPHGGFGGGPHGGFGGHHGGFGGFPIPLPLPIPVPGYGYPPYWWQGQYGPYFPGAPIPLVPREEDLFVDELSTDENLLAEEGIYNEDDERPPGGGQHSGSSGHQHGSSHNHGSGSSGHHQHGHHHGYPGHYHEPYGPGYHHGHFGPGIYGGGLIPIPIPIPIGSGGGGGGGVQPQSYVYVDIVGGSTYPNATATYQVTYQPGMTIFDALASTGVIQLAPDGQIVLVSGVVIGGKVNYMLRFNGRVIPTSMVNFAIQPNDTVGVELIYAQD